MSIAYHPQSNGQSKFLNRTLETYLSCLFCWATKSLGSFWGGLWSSSSFNSYVDTQRNTSGSCGAGPNGKRWGFETTEVFA